MQRRGSGQCHSMTILDLTGRRGSMKDLLGSYESSPSLVDRLADGLKDMILNGELSPDEPLNISSIAKQNGVSLVPVREALARLGAMGLLQFAPNRGYRMAPKLELETRTKLFEAREILERAAVPLAVTYRTDAQLTLLRALNAEMRALGRKKSPNHKSFFRLNHQFHRIYVQTTSNLYLDRMFESLSFDLHLSREARDSIDITRLSEEHDEIISALEKKDVSRLDAILMNHIRSTR